MLGSLIPRRERFLIPTSDRFSRLVRRMEEEMEDLVDRFWGGDGGWLPTAYVPTLDLVETENQFEVKVDLPGLKPEEVQVELKGDELWISGKHEEEKKEEGKTYHRMERRYGEFRRVLPLPSTVKEEGIEARFENGVLTVTLPKSEEAKPKHIEVKA